MLDIPQLHQQILALKDGDDTLRRQTLQSLRNHDEKQWATAPIDVSHSLVKVLKGQLLNGSKQPFAQKEVATILGNMGTRSKSALPELIELLHEGVPDPVRQAAVIALGKIGKEARVAVDQLVQLLANSRPPLLPKYFMLGNMEARRHSPFRPRRSLVLTTATPERQGTSSSCPLQTTHCRPECAWNSNWNSNGESGRVPSESGSRSIGMV